jgi:hypothetical protein
VSLALLFQDERPQLGPLIADLTTEEVYQARADWTDLRIEAGAQLSDHFEIAAGELPLRVMIGSVGDDRLVDRGRSNRWLADIDNILRAGELHTITTGVGEFAGMALQNYRYVRGLETSYAAVIDTTWRQIEVGITQSFASFAEAAADQGLAEVDLGDQGVEVVQ